MLSTALFFQPRPFLFQVAVLCLNPEIIPSSAFPRVCACGWTGVSFDPINRRPSFPSERLVPGWMWSWYHLGELTGSTTLVDVGHPTVRNGNGQRVTFISFIMVTRARTLSSRTFWMKRNLLIGSSNWRGGERGRWPPTRWQWQWATSDIHFFPSRQQSDDTDHFTIEDLFESAWRISPLWQHRTAIDWLIIPNRKHTTCSFSMRW